MYLDTFTAPNGTALSSHTADAGFGSWVVDSNYPGQEIVIQGNRGTSDYNIAGTAGYHGSGTVRGLSGLLPFQAYADLHFPIVSQGEGVEWVLGSYEPQYDPWPSFLFQTGYYHDPIELMDGWYVESNYFNITGIAQWFNTGVTDLRIGLVYDPATGGRFYKEPYGGGTRTYLMTATPLLADIQDGAPFLLIQNADFEAQSGTHWIDNLTVIAGATAVPVRVIVTPPLAFVGQGGQAQFVGTAYDASGNTLSDTLTWASNNTALASVDSTGLVTAATGSFTSGFVTISASDGTYATGTALLAVVLANAGLFERGAWMGTNSAPGSGRYIREVVYGIGTTGWETPTPSWGTNQWPWPSSITTQPNGAGPQIGFEVISGSTSTSSAPTGIAVQEYNNGILLSSTTAFTNPAWSSASTYALRLFWDGSSSKLTPYWNGSGSTSTGTAILLSSAFTNTWALQNWLGGVDHPSAVSADRQGYWLRSTATGNPWQPYYAL